MTDTKTKKLVAEGVSDPETGRFYLVFFTLENQLKNPLYLEVQRPGYLFTDSIINPYKLTKSIQHIALRLVLQKLKKGKRFTLFEIGFHFKSSTPLPRSQNSMEALLRNMRNYKSLEIRIEGHANGCCDIERSEYSEAEAQKVSIKRANAIAQFLI